LMRFVRKKRRSVDDREKKKKGPTKEGRRNFPLPRNWGREGSGGGELLFGQPRGKEET